MGQLCLVLQGNTAMTTGDTQLVNDACQDWLADSVGTINELMRLVKTSPCRRLEDNSLGLCIPVTSYKKV